MCLLSIEKKNKFCLTKVPIIVGSYIYEHNLDVAVRDSKSLQTKQNIFIYHWNESKQKKSSNEIASAIFHRVYKHNLRNVVCEQITQLFLQCFS